MTTPTPDALALLAAVAAKPDCDTTRLALADELLAQSERSVPCLACGRPGHEASPTSSASLPLYWCGQCDERTRTVPDREAADRAEFIRVQVELARRWGGDCRACGKKLGHDRIADGCPCNSPRGVNHGIVPAYVCTCPECDPKQTGSVRDMPLEVDQLCVRESVLLAAHPEWRPTCPVCNADGNRRGTGQPCCGGSGRVGELRRGLIECVEVSRLEDCIRRCRSIRHVWPAGTLWQEDKDCPRCRGLGWVATEWAAGLMRDPFTRVVRRVMVGGREPYRVRRSTVNPFCWRCVDDPGQLVDPHLIPMDLFPHLIAPEKGEGIPMVWYSTPDAAREALGTAIADVLRALVPARS